MSLLIRNADVVNADSRFRADIFAEGDTITRIGTNLEAPPGADVIDATGKLVFPGFIDPHVHIYLPFMATFAKDTHETGSIAALIGGTTTFIEMCCPNRTDDALEGFHLWKSKAEGSSACDYSFHMSVTKYDPKTESQLREIVADGIASFKIFLAYKNFFGVDDGEMYQTMRLAKELGVSRPTLKEAVNQLVHEGLLTREEYKGITVATVTSSDLSGFNSGSNNAIDNLAMRSRINSAPTT